MSKEKIYILAIESSCDDTSAAVLCNDKVLSNYISNQSIHERYGGVVPELASRAHEQNIIPVVSEALKEAQITANQLSAIAFTRGPGLMGSLLVGTSFAKSLSLALSIPLIDVHHMQAHLLAHFIDEPGYEKPTFPFLGVTLSGGHTQIFRINDYFDFELLGETKDDAIGEAFDKTGKMLGLGYPAGPEIDRRSKNGNPEAFSFPIPKVEGLDLSYSGFKTSVLYFLQKQLAQDSTFIEKNLDDLCASIQHCIITIIMQKIKKAIQETGLQQIAIGGGVSANSGLRNRLQAYAEENDLKVFLPKFSYTTDNAAMIGIAGYYKFLNKDFAPLNLTAQARMPF